MAPDPQFLGKIPLFAGMDEDERAALAQIMDEIQFRAGQAIYRADDVGGSFYIIKAGQVEMSITDDDGEKLILEVLEAGDFCGELSLIDGGTRSATAMATQRTDMLVLDRNEFSDLLLQRPHMAQDVMTALVKRIRRTDNLLRRRVSRNPNEAIDAQETIGDRVADAVARFGGSWSFIFAFGAILAIWVLLNTIALGKEIFDPYPFILLNLFLSMLAAIQAPVIMMSQNRQDTKDRIRSELDYQVNLKAELEINQLTHRVEEIRDMVEDLHQIRATR